MTNSKNFQKSLLIFRQDLRLDDNAALDAALAQSTHIFPVFFFDPTILEKFPKPDARLGFLIDALRALDAQLRNAGSRLRVFHADPTEKIPELAKTREIDAIFRNKSYGRGATTRDPQIRDRANQNWISLISTPDFLLVEPREVPTRKVFTPFFKLRSRHLAENPVPQPRIFSEKFSKIPTPQKSEPFFEKKSPEFSRAHDNEKIFAQIPAAKNQHRPIDARRDTLANFDPQKYPDTRNFPALAHGTSQLSPYHRFWLVSIRQIFHRAHRDREEKNIFVSELARREFRQQIFFNFPDTAHHEFQEKRRDIPRKKWENSKKLFDARAQARTGYPIVDAAMRQLRTSNRMHNRCRMIVASFLTKDLLIDRRQGEREFENRLIDYDFPVNLGNRQRAASVGADPKPLRIFNPILQSQRFDPDAEFIKKRIPELAHHSPAEIHDPLTHRLDRHDPIIDHFAASRAAKAAYLQKIPAPTGLFDGEK